MTCVEVGVPHDDARVLTVMFKELLHAFTVETHLVVVVRRHGKEVVNTQPVACPQILPRV